MKFPHSISAAACAALVALSGCSNQSGGAPKVESTPTTASPSPTLATPSPSPTVTPVVLGKLLKNGSKGHAVETLQSYLYQSGQKPYYVACGYDGQFGPNTKAALQQWQRANGHKPTGKVHVRSTQWQQLREQATAHRLPAGIDPRAIQLARKHGKAIDANKNPGCVNVLKADSAAPHGIKVTRTIAASYGGYIDGAYRPTTDGVFRITSVEGPDYVADVPGKPWDGAPMPWAAFYYDGEAFHYDPLSTSHGCVHIPSMAVAKYIHDLGVGTPVVIHGKVA